MDWLKRVHPGASATSGEAFGPGDDVRVWYRIIEQGRERLGQFEGVVMRCAGGGASRTFTVRRVTHGEGVERVFPFDAPVLDRVEVLRRGKVRRSRLYFLRRRQKKTRLDTAEAGGAPAAPNARAGIEGAEHEDAVSGAQAGGGPVADA
jgi:large subunit ribosomal protein L19